MTDLAPVLLDAAETGDTVARQVVSRLADEIAALGSVALRRLDLLDTPADVVLGGGVLAARRPLLMDAVTARYATRAPPPASSSPKTPAPGRGPPGPRPHARSPTVPRNPPHRLPPPR